MTDLWLVRHGEAAASWEQSEDPGLSALGHEQAQRTAAKLAEILPADVRIMSSPMARARETAAPLASLLGQPVVVDEAFSEVKAPVPLAQRKQWLRQFMRERWPQQAEQHWLWRHHMLENLLSQTQPAVIFTHFLVINTILGAATDADAVLLAWPANASFHRFHSDGKTLTLIEKGEEMASVVL